MQPTLINGKTLMMSSVGLKASKASKIVSSFHLILKIFFSFAETKVQITEDDKKIIYHLRKSLLFDKGNT